MACSVDIAAAASEMRSALVKLTRFDGVIVSLATLMTTLVLLYDAGNYVLFLASLTAAYAIAAMGYNLLMGQAGQFDFGQAAFLGIGAYAFTLSGKYLEVPFWVSIILAGLCSVLVGMAIGALVLRLRHFYLGLVTLSFNQTVVLVMGSWESLTGGYQGLPVPRFTLPMLTRSQSLLVVCAVTWLALFLIARNLVRSRIGSAWAGVRDNEIAARSFGVAIVRYRILAYAVGAFYGGIAGSLIALLLSHIGPQSFGTFETVKLLAMIVVGGLGSIGGSILGAALLTLGPELFRFSQLFQEIGFGLILLLAIIFLPGGIAGTGARIRNWLAKPREKA
jgi:branched-chain amino acid transport system permease protein